MTKGVCKLTGSFGKFIKAHLIPRALTRPESPGLPFIQSGFGSRPTRKWSSWYDPRLVTQEGEDILTSLDTWAISELRKHKLVWSGWGPMNALLTKGYTPIPGSPYGVHVVHGLDHQRLRLFFLSLLWRAAATNREEFVAVDLPVEHIERLRTMITANEPSPIDFYPVTLSQMSTMGIVHNQSPLSMLKSMPASEGTPGRDLPIFRFYFDGLMAHFHRQDADNGETVALGDLIVGANDRLVISTISYEASFQRENLTAVMAEAAENWPAILAKL